MVTLEKLTRNSSSSSSFVKTMAKFQEETNTNPATQRITQENFVRLITKKLSYRWDVWKQGLRVIY